MPTVPIQVRRIALVALTLAASSLALTGGEAAASTLSLHEGVLTFRSQLGDWNKIDVSLRPRRAPTQVVVRDYTDGSKAPAAGPGCAYESPPDPTRTGTVTLSCPLSVGEPLPRVRISLGQSDWDQAASVDDRLNAVVHGGAGFDTISANGKLFGGPGPDSITARGTGTQRLWGGPGGDEIYAGPGPDIIHPGPGEDEVWLANQRRGKTAWKDRAQDIVWSRDGESDDLYCDADRPADRLLVDELDWPTDRGKRMCAGVFRSSPPLPLPFAIYSPDYEYDDGTTVWVFCPWDGPPICTGRIVVRVAGRKLGPEWFRMRAGRERSYKLSRAEFGLDDDARPALVTLRTLDRDRRLRRVTRTLFIPGSPYDSAQIPTETRFSNVGENLGAQTGTP
jgi:hypothetical protein